MAGYYIIAGRKVATEYLTLATLGLLGAGIVAARSRSAAKTVQKLESNSFSNNTEENDFIKEFLKNVESEAKH
jgi:F-type H+-transporting ATPase subunit k